MNNLRRFGLKEVHKIKELLEQGYTHKEIAKALDRPLGSISYIATSVGITKRWKEQELNFLKETYNKITLDKIGFWLGRSEMAVRKFRYKQRDLIPSARSPRKQIKTTATKTISNQSSDTKNN